jgi:crotonobetainyl-CoA:carnitine CoA-transferase CaiB-like acyl-CoA transferase
MTRPFEGIRIIDITHVLAGPFAAYQLAVLGADVIKVEHPEEPDQSREGGTDRALNRRNMGTSFLTQGSNKRSITLNLKAEEGREILKKLVACSDVLVENYRPGAFEALALAIKRCCRSTRVSSTARSRHSGRTAFGASKLPTTM